MAFGLANTRSLYRRMLDVAMKEVEPILLPKYRLKLSCYEDGPTLEPIADNKISRTLLVDGECLDFEKRKSGKTWRATREQKISPQAWRILREKVTIN